MSETSIMKAIRDKLSRGAVRLYRNNVGQGLMVYHKHAQTKQTIITRCIALANELGGSASRLSFGLGVGTGDLIGYQRIRITPEMVGRDMLVFVSCEVKTDAGASREEQVAWAEHVCAMGGKAFVARSVEQAQQELDKPFIGVEASGSTTGETE